MEKVKRSIFFWSLTALFLLTAPIVVLRARGYRFDTSRGVFVYSGTVTFKSNPQEADIRLNGELTESKKLNRINNSYNIGGLLPSDYNIRISADGFQTWNKKIDVHSGVASEFWNIILARNDYEKNSVSVAGLDKFFTSPRNNFIVYPVSQEAGLSVKIFNIEDETEENIFNFSGWKFIDGSRKENIEWSPDDLFLSVPVQKESLEQGADSAIEYNYFILDPENNTAIDLGQFLGIKDIREARWDPEKKGYLFFLSQNSLWRVNISDSADLTPIATDVSGYDLSRNEVYYVKRSNNLIFKNGLDGSAEPIQVTSDFPGQEETVVPSITVYDDQRIALISENNDLFMFNEGEADTYFKKLGSNVEDAHFSNDGKKLLFWSGSEISVYFVRKWDVQPVRSENETQNITRFSEPLHNVQWFFDYEHIIFSAGKWTKIIELDSRDRRNCMDIVGTELERPFVIYNGFLERLYFTDAKDGTTSLFYLEFPEPTPFLGVIGR